MHYVLSVSLTSLVGRFLEVSELLDRSYGLDTNSKIILREVWVNLCSNR